MNDLYTSGTYRLFFFLISNLIVPLRFLSNSFFSLL